MFIFFRVANIQRRTAYYTIIETDVKKVVGIHGRILRRIKNISKADIEITDTIPKQFILPPGEKGLCVCGSDLAIVCAVAMMNSRLKVFFFWYGRDTQFECGRECILSCGTVHSSQPANYLDWGICFVHSMTT